MICKSGTFLVFREKKKQKKNSVWSGTCSRRLFFCPGIPKIIWFCATYGRILERWNSCSVCSLDVSTEEKQAHNTMLPSPHFSTDTSEEFVFFGWWTVGPVTLLSICIKNICFISSEDIFPHCSVRRGVLVCNSQCYTNGSCVCEVIQLLYVYFISKHHLIKYKLM